MSLRAHPLKDYRLAGFRLTGRPLKGRPLSVRSQLSFRRVNASGSSSYDPSLQRHHILPRQLLSKRCFGSFFAAIGRDQIGFDDFRENGLLLPATDEAVLRLGMPLHRGPHKVYNELAIQCVGLVEKSWSRQRLCDAEQARDVAISRLRVIQGTLRQRLLSQRNRIVLNHKDPLGTGFDFTELDAMAETLWASTNG